MAWLTGYSYRKKITFDADKIYGTVLDFPVRVLLDSTVNFDFTKAKSALEDIRFTSSDGSTLLKYEIESLIDTGDKLADIDVKIPSVAGDGSVYFDGASYLSIPNSSDFNFGSGDFTINFRIKFTSTATAQVFLGRNGSSDRSWNVYYSSSNLRFAGYWNGATQDVAFSWSPSTGTWYDIEIIRSGVDVKAFVDGSQIGSTYNMSTYTIRDSSSVFYIGENVENTGYQVKGYMDEVRLSKGIARHTSNFTIATTEFTSDSYTKLLLHFKNNFTDSGETVHTLTEVGFPDFGAGVFPPTDTYFYIYYGNASASDGQDAVNVWDSNHKGVWHLKEVGNGTAGEYKDSTSYANDGQGFTAPTRVTGKIGYGQDLASANNIRIPDDADLELGASNFYLHFKVKFDSVSGNFGLLTRYTGGSSYFYIAIESGNMRFRDFGGSGVDFSVSPSFSTDIWYDVLYVRKGTKWQVYIDGVKTGTTYTASATLTDRSVYWNWGGETSLYDGFDGKLDEIRVVIGSPKSYSWTNARLNSDNNTLLTFGAEEEGVVNFSETIYLSDNWELQTDPDQQSISDTVVLDDTWEFLTNPELADLDDTIELDDTWELLTDPDTVLVSDTTTLADSWGFSFISRIPLNLDLRWLASIARVINTSLSWLIAKKISTDFRWLGLNRKTIATDFRWLALPYTTLPLTPISPANIQIFINGMDVLLGNDVDLQTGNILHTAGQMSQASFILARRHDDINRTHTGATSQITNQNPVQIYIAGYLEFDGYVMTINVDSERETVAIVAQMEEPASNRHAVELPLPSVNEKLHLYHCLVNNVSIDNPKEDTRDVIIGSHGRYWNGSSWVFYIEDALIFATDIAAQTYIDTYVDSTVNQVFFSKSPSVTSRQKNPQYYKGVKVDLGTEIRQQVNRYRQLETIFNGKGVYAQQIEDGTFVTKPNYTYFWAVKSTNVLTGFYNGDFRYIGTSLASTTTDLWVLNGVTPMRQRIKDDLETELGYHYVGSAPYKEISTKNGILIPTDKWEDRTDGLYNVLEEGYNYTNYAKRVAELEYEKLKNTDGNILPITSANIDVTFDAYYFYNIKLLTRINVSNTTVSNTYKNTNGFPTSVKSININFATMKITLNTTNRLSQDELDEIDQQMPDEESSEYITPERATRIYRKYDLKSRLFVS